MQSNNKIEYQSKNLKKMQFIAQEREA